MNTEEEDRKRCRFKGPSGEQCIKNGGTRGFCDDHPEPECPRMDQAQMIEFAEGYVEGSIWTSKEVMDRGGGSLIGMVFMPIMLGGAPPKTGLIWASIKTDRTFGRAVNGIPIFASCHVMHLDDLPICEAAIEKIRAAKERVREELAR